MKTALYVLLPVAAGVWLWWRPYAPEPVTPVRSVKTEQRSAHTEYVKAKVDHPSPTATPKPETTAESLLIAGPSKKQLTVYDDKMTDWLLETGQRMQNLHVREVSRRAGQNDSVVIEGVSDEGHNLKEHVDAEGRLLADEVIFSDGRKLSRLYHPDGKFKAVYFEQSRERAYSGIFNENGQPVEVTELSANGKQTRRNPL